MSGLVVTEDTIDVITEAQIAVDRSAAMQTIVGSVFKKEALLEERRRAADMNRTAPEVGMILSEDAVVNQEVPGSAMAGEWRFLVVQGHGAPMTGGVPCGEDEICKDHQFVALRRWLVGVGGDAPLDDPRRVPAVEDADGISGFIDRTVELDRLATQLERRLDLIDPGLQLDHVAMLEAVDGRLDVASRGESDRVCVHRGGRDDERDQK